MEISIIFVELYLVATEELLEMNKLYASVWRGTQKLFA